MKQTQEQVMEAVQTELDYQNKATQDPSQTHMIEDFHVGDSLSAMQYNLDKAREQWYKGSTPHQGCMEFIRKITAIGIKMGMTNGMPHRK